MIVFLSLLTIVSSSIDYHQLLEVIKGGEIDVIHVESQFHEKINPILQSRKMWEDNKMLSLYTSLMEAKDCLYDTECEKEHKASGKQQDYSDQYKDKDWLGFEQLNAQTFREKVIKSDDQWLIVFADKPEYALRNVLIDFRYIVGPSIKLAYVACDSSSYNLCTGGPNTPSLMQWPRKLYFEGEVTLFNIAKFHYTYTEVDIKNYAPDDVHPHVNATKKSLVLIDSTSEGLEYIEMKTALALLSGYADVGIIDCQKYYKDCHMYDKEKMPISAMYVPYMKSSEILDNEPYFRSFSARIKTDGKVEEFIGEVLKRLASERTYNHEGREEKNELDYVLTDSRKLHKDILKATHGKIPPIVVYLGEAAPTLRLLALKRFLYPFELHILECSSLELYCFRYKADEDTPRFLVVKSGGFEYLETRENVLDRVKAFLYAKSSKLTTLRGEDLYGMLAEGPLNNTLIQYYNSSTYDMAANGHQYETGFGYMRKTANAVMEMFGTKMFTVDCALSEDICQANKVDYSGAGEVHFILTSKILKETTEPVEPAEYIAFIENSMQKDTLTEEVVPPDSAASSDEVKMAFDKFHSEL